MKHLGSMGMSIITALVGLTASLPFADVDRSFDDISEPPNRLSADERSRWHHPCCTQVDVWFNGKRRPNDVVEYDAREGWIIVKIGNQGRRMKLFGDVDPRWRDKSARAEHRAATPKPVHDDRAAIEAAKAKRERKAAKLSASKGGAA